jgi:hypothetical protein
MSQTFFVPVSSRSCRKASRSVRRGSTSNSCSKPFTFKVTRLRLGFAVTVRGGDAMARPAQHVACHAPCDVKQGVLASTSDRDRQSERSSSRRNDLSDHFVARSNAGQRMLLASS